MFGIQLNDPTRVKGVDRALFGGFLSIFFASARYYDGLLFEVHPIPGHLQDRFPAAIV
jgi:hypothetical protein